jgi:hypothetical protein
MRIMTLFDVVKTLYGNKYGYVSKCINGDAECLTISKNEKSITVCMSGLEAAKSKCLDQMLISKIENAISNLNKL